MLNTRKAEHLGQVSPALWQSETQIISLILVKQNVGCVLAQVTKHLKRSQVEKTGGWRALALRYVSILIFMDLTLSESLG